MVPDHLLRIRGPLVLVPDLVLLLPRLLSDHLIQLVVLRAHLDELLDRLVTRLACCRARVDVSRGQLDELDTQHAGRHVVSLAVLLKLLVTEIRTQLTACSLYTSCSLNFSHLSFCSLLTAL